MAKSDVCLEIHPDNFVLVIGPNFTINVVKELTESCQLSTRRDAAGFQDASKSIRMPDFALKHIVDQGINLLLGSEEYTNEAERSKCELLYRNAYELDPQFAMKKVSMSLQKSGRYAEWLRRTFEVQLEAQHLTSHSVSLHRIIELQKKGALLVYVQCDDILSRLSRTSPVLLEDSEGLEQWLKGEKHGFLHVHGVYWEPDTVKLDGQFYENSNHYIRPASERLKHLFQKRHTVVIGCESHPSDPLLGQFIKEYMSEEQQRFHQQHTFHLPLSPVSSNQTSGGLPIIPSSLESGQFTSYQPVHSILCPMTESSVSLCKSIAY